MYKISFDYNKQYQGYRVEFKTIVYTAIFGDKDTLLPAPKFDNCDFVCFTDNDDLLNDSKGWEICIQRLDPSNPRLNARLYKTIPHGFFSTHERSVWLDGNVTLNTHPENVFSTMETPMAVYKHPYAETLKDEEKLCSERGFNKDGIITNHAQTGVIFRKHNDPKVIATMDTWFNEIRFKSIRDQISFSYSCWKNDLDYTIITDNSFTVHKHKI
jgi:hypothetical protein